MNDPRFIPGTSSPTELADKLPPMRWPSWMDSTYALVASAPSIQRIDTTGIAPSVVIPGNSRRWGLIVIPSAGLITSWALTPDGVPLTHGFSASTTGQAQRFTIFEFGPLVGGPWTLTCNGNGTFFAVSNELQ